MQRMTGYSKNLVFQSWACLFILISLVGCTSDEQINRECSLEYKNSILARMQCIQNREDDKRQQKADADKIKAENQREKNARSCIASDLKRIEGLAKQVDDLVTEDSTLSKLQPPIDNLLVSSSQIRPSDDNIKENVLINTIKTKCDSKFHYLINIMADETGKVKSIKLFSEDSPEGYIEGYIEDFSKNLVKIRQQERLDFFDQSSRVQGSSNGEPALSLKSINKKTINAVAVRFTNAIENGMSGITADVMKCYQDAKFDNQAIQVCMLYDLMAFRLDSEDRAHWMQSIQKDPGPINEYLSQNAFSSRLDNNMEIALTGVPQKHVFDFYNRKCDELEAYLLKLHNEKENNPN